MFGKCILIFCCSCVSIIGARSQAGICAELFRSTPAQIEVLNHPFTGFMGGNPSLDSPGPSESRIMNAVLTDILSVNSLSSWARYSVKRVFSLLHLDRSRHDDLLVEFHRRRYAATMREFAVPTHRDIWSRLRDNRQYLSLAFSAGANGAVNLFSYHFFNSFGFIVHIPEVRVFNPRTLPNYVLNELIETGATNDTPKTRDFIAAKIRYGADAVLASGRRAFNLAALGIVVAVGAEIAVSQKSAGDWIIDTAASSMHRAAVEQNRLSLIMAHEKRQSFINSGDTEKAAEADRLIAELQRTLTSDGSPRRDTP